MTQLTDKVYAVEVPEDAWDIKIETYPTQDWYMLNCKTENNEKVVEEEHELPPGNWQFLFTIKGMTEDQAAQVVRELPVGSRYENYCAGYPFWFRAAGESLRSLLRSKGLDTEKNYAIIKKEP